jgi:coenzyme F420-reducing hydrogenase alpha subunit
MEKIKVNKQELLGIVKQNREKHNNEYLESIKAYRVNAADTLQKELDKIISGEKFQTWFDLKKPESHVKDYDIAIKMLEMSVDDTIVISEDEFNQLVQDNWTWKSIFKNSYYSNSSYIGVNDVSAFSGFTGSSGSEGTTMKIKFADDEIL